MNKKITITVGFLLILAFLGAYFIWVYNRNYVETFEAKGELFTVTGKIHLGPKKNQLDISEITSTLEENTLLTGVKLEVIEENRIIYQRMYGTIRVGDSEYSSINQSFTLKEGLEKIRVDANDQNNLDSQLTRKERENWKEKVRIQITIQKEDETIVEEQLKIK